METTAETFPVWETQPVAIDTSNLEYKFIMYDEHGNLQWEDGENRQIDLSSFKASKVLIEDEGWNHRGSQGKIITLAAAPLKQTSNLDKEIEEFAAKYSAKKVREGSAVRETLKRDDSKFTTRFREEEMSERTDREVRRISAKEYARNVVANSPTRNQQSPTRIGTKVKLEKLSAEKESIIINHD